MGNWTVLHHAAWHGLAEVCQVLLERPDFTRANSKSTYGLTALHCASHRGHLRTVRVLLTSNTFTEIDSREAQFDRDGRGWSARDVAAFCGHTAVVEAIDRIT